MKFKLIIPILIMVIMTSCTRVIVDTEDEIRMNKWSASLKNGSSITLVFEDDIAEFKIYSKDKGAQADLKGLCVIDDKKILIYNQNEGEPYFFDYKVKNNELILRYDGGKLVLNRD